MGFRTDCAFALALLGTGPAVAADGLPMFAPGKVDYVIEYGLTVNGQVINKAGKAVSPMGSPRNGTLCFRHIGSMLSGMTGFLPGTNGVVKPSGQVDQCKYSQLNVNGNTAVFTVSCSSGSPAIADTSGQVTHTFDPAASQVVQKFSGSNLYGKSVEETHIYRRVGDCK